MFRTIFCLFLIIHILGDFYFQNADNAKEKQTSYKKLSLHCFYYLLISVICILPFYSTALLLTAVALAVFHFLVDCAKYICIRKTKKTILDSQLYLADQIIHFCGIAVAALVLVNADIELNVLPMINNVLLIATYNTNDIFKWAGLVLIAHKPINDTIRQLIGKYKPTENNELSSEYTVSAGAFIGTLERIIIFVLLSLGQFAAIGLVMTAKSVARYNKISEDKQFAEYYLSGTLLSTLFAIVLYNVIF